KPYGYEGLGEVSVLVFFGLVATVGSAYIHVERIDGVAVVGGAVVGLLACAILLANNIRDVRTDAVTGKRTLARRARAHRGPPRPRGLSAARGAAASPGGAALGLVRPPALLALAAVPLAWRPARAILDDTAPPPRLVGALIGTARLELVTGLLLALGLALS